MCSFELLSGPSNDNTRFSMAIWSIATVQFANFRGFHTNSVEREQSLMGFFTVVRQLIEILNGDKLYFSVSAEGWNLRKLTAIRTDE